MSLYAELIQSRIVGRIAKDRIDFKTLYTCRGFRLGGRSDALEVEEDSGSHLDYSGGRKTHRFPPPNGLGSHSLTHRPTENPTGMTHWLGLQGILNHAPLCSAVQNDDKKPLTGHTPSLPSPSRGRSIFSP